MSEDGQAGVPLTEATGRRLAEAMERVARSLEEQLVNAALDAPSPAPRRVARAHRLPPKRGRRG